MIPGTVTVRLFSVLRERIGVDALELPMSEAATVASALDVLSSRYSVIGDYRRYVRVAVNAAYAEDDRALSPGDELALITPVSGG